MIKVHFFAGLKRYFDAPVHIESDGLTSIKDIIVNLKAEKPEASELLEKCRVAVNENFVSLETSVQGIMEVFIIPPSSGG